MLSLYPSNLKVEEKESEGALSVGELNSPRVAPKDFYRYQT